jgi:hypothetical protein
MEQELLLLGIEMPLFSTRSDGPEPPDGALHTSKWIHVSVASCTKLLPGGTLFDKLDDLIDVRLWEFV